MTPNQYQITSCEGFSWWRFDAS